MAQEKPNRLVEWYLIVKEQAPILREQFREWVRECIKEPTLFWETTAARYTVYAVSGLIAMWTFTGLINIWTPPQPESARPEATSADYHVLCTSCDAHFVIHRDFGFDDFPVNCNKCSTETGKRARRCNSNQCRGKWIIPQKHSNQKSCPNCQHVFPR